MKNAVPEESGDAAIDPVLAWCTEVLGPIRLLSDHTRHHPGDRTVTLRLGTSTGSCYLKIHRMHHRWAQEVHGYEQWAPVFGDFAPTLLAVRDEAPLAFVISELPGKPLDGSRLPPAQEQAVWRSAGTSLSSLHQSAEGAHFGPCDRAGACTGDPISDPVTYVASELRTNLDKGIRAGHLSDSEQDLIRSAIGLTTVYAGQRPVPCHRDYCGPNLLVSDDGVWSGVIDFEFAHWDVAATDFSRDANWTWMDRPEMMDACLEGYGLDRSPESELQILICLVRYGLDAIIWGSENDYLGFAREGREALERLRHRI